mgnify:CR=1 FL=1
MTEYSDNPSAHPEAPHMINRANWLRAAVLGANDGIVSVSALIVGVAAADPSPQAILIAGAAGLAAGAMSMAAGEYVTVSSQSDIERADLDRERTALAEMPDQELAELAAIFESRGMTAATALQAAREVTLHDALGAHAREELGLHDVNQANPLQAAFASLVTFAIAAAVPLVSAMLAPAKTAKPQPKFTSSQPPPSSNSSRETNRSGSGITAAERTPTAGASSTIVGGRSTSSTIRR